MDIYMLFAGPQYYPGGGTEDLCTSFRAPDDEAAVGSALAHLRGPNPRKDGWRCEDWHYLVALDDVTLLWRPVWDPHDYLESNTPGLPDFGPGIGAPCVFCSGGC